MCKSAKRFCVVSCCSHTHCCVFILFILFFFGISNFVVDTHRTILENLKQKKGKSFYNSRISRFTRGRHTHIPKPPLTIYIHFETHFLSFRLNLYFVRACGRARIRRTCEWTTERVNKCVRVISIHICGNARFFRRTLLAYLIWKQINFIIPQTIEHSVCEHFVNE